MVCEGVVIINRGRIVASGSLDRLMEELSPVARIQVQIDGPADLVAASLRALRGVTRVEARGVSDGVGTFVVEADRAHDIRRDLVQLVTAQRWGLLELRALGLSLEDLFLQVVTGEEHGDTGEGERGGVPQAEGRSDEEDSGAGEGGDGA